MHQSDQAPHEGPDREGGDPGADPQRRDGLATLGDGRREPPGRGVTPQDAAGAAARGRATDTAPMRAPAPSRSRGRRGDGRSCWRTAAPFVWRRSTDRPNPTAPPPRRGQAGSGLPSRRVAPPCRTPVRRGLLDAVTRPAAPRRGARPWRPPWRPAGPTPPASTRAGRAARALLDSAREVLAAALGVRADELSVHASPEAALELGLTGLRHAPAAHRRPRRRRRHRALGAAPPAGRRAAGPGRPHRAGSTSRRMPPPSPAAASRPRCSRPPTARSAPASPSPRSTAACREHGVPLLARRDGIPGARRAVPSPRSAPARSSSPTPRRSAGRRSVCSPCAPAPGGACPVPRREAEHGREPAPPWVPLVLAAAEAWRQAAAGRGAEEPAARALVDRVRAAAAAVPDVEVVGRPRRPAPPRRDLQRALRRRRGAARGARPPRPRSSRPARRARRARCARATCSPRWAC